MEKYKFSEFSSSEYKKDMVFSNDSFDIYGSPGNLNSPILFCVEKYRYVITEPLQLKSNEELLFKIGAYLYHNPSYIDNVPVTYFFGDISKCKDISDEFKNQVIKIVSYEMVEEWYPKTLNDINDRVIKFLLNKQKFYGQIFLFDDKYDYNYLFFVPKYMEKAIINNGIDFIKSQLFSKGLLIKKRAYSDTVEFILSELAVDKFQSSEITKDKFAFIAIKFSHNEERIQSIQNAIVRAGYIPVIMNEHEHNNWIMPEIFHQIKISKFVVVDLSVRCDGAYYEAGYAYALGKEVIHTYDLNFTETNPLHFDVAQKSTIMYNDLCELENKLYNRIISTVNR